MVNSLVDLGFKSLTFRDDKYLIHLTSVSMRFLLSIVDFQRDHFWFESCMFLGGLGKIRRVPAVLLPDYHVDWTRESRTEGVQGKWYVCYNLVVTRLVLMCWHITAIKLHYAPILELGNSGNPRIEAIFSLSVSVLPQVPCTESHNIWRLSSDGGPLSSAQLFQPPFWQWFSCALLGLVDYRSAGFCCTYIG